MSALPAKNLRQVGRTSFDAGGPNGANVSARGIFESQRTRLLDRRQSYYDSTQHDYKAFDFDGRIIQSSGGITATQPLMSAEKFPGFIPLRERRPSSPYRLARVIVKSFTNLLLGEGRFPAFRVDGDDDTQDFVAALVKAAQLPVKMIRARDLGGAVGSVGLSWCFLDGKPRVEVHNARNLYVHTWFDREQCMPRHVTELYQFPQDDWNPEKRCYERNHYWYRRDWTPDEDVLFKPILVEINKDPSPDQWEPDLDKSSRHEDGVTHFVWIQNQPSEDVDGLPDYEGLYEEFDSIDLVKSVLTRGAVLNLDPTLKLNMDVDQVNRMGVRKGSDNALVVGKDGDAGYLELGGTSIAAGISLLDKMRQTTLEVAQCVLPDPDEVAAGSTSSVALKVVYAPMLGACDALREQYGGGMVRLLTAMVEVARSMEGRAVTVYDEDGNAEEVEQVLRLPPRVTREPEMGEDGNPTGEDKVTLEERSPGQGTEVEVDWGPYFPKTADEQQKAVTTLSVATGQQAFVSQESAAELAAGVYGRDPHEEWSRLQKAQGIAEQKQADMFAMDPGAGASVTKSMALPSGASVKHQVTPQAPANDAGAAPAAGASITLAPTDVANVVKVDEARKIFGLDPIGGEDGEMPVTAFAAKYAQSIAVAANAALGKTGDPPDADAEPPAPPGGGPPFGAKPGGPPGAGPPGAPPGQPPGAKKPPFPPKK